MRVDKKGDRDRQQRNAPEGVEEQNPSGPEGSAEDRNSHTQIQEGGQQQTAYEKGAEDPAAYKRATAFVEQRTRKMVNTVLGTPDRRVPRQDSKRGGREEKVQSKIKPKEERQW